MENQKRIKVIITEDHLILRQGLTMLLNDDSEIEIVGEAVNGVELLDMLQQTPADVVLMDLNMPEMDGFEATQSIVATHPGTKVIALSMFDSLAHIQKMMNCGASGYLLKTIGKDELRYAIKLVASGTHYICSDLSMHLLSNAGKGATTIGKNADQAGLSNREVEILTLIADGLTNSEIADKLFTSKRTIETHRQNILEKTGAKNTPHLIKFAIRNNIISLDTPE